jgi:hypothetical protein
MLEQVLSVVAEQLIEAGTRQFRGDHVLLLGLECLAMLAPLWPSLLGLGYDGAFLMPGESGSPSGTAAMGARCPCSRAK